VGFEVHHAQEGVPYAAVVLDKGRQNFDGDALDLVCDPEHADAVDIVGAGSDIGVVGDQGSGIGKTADL
jgi:hypothetical protein